MVSIDVAFFCVLIRSNDLKNTILKPALLEDTEHPLHSQLNQFILDNLPDLIVSCRLSDFSFEYANPATLSVLGYTPEELFSYSAFDLVHPEDLPGVIEELNKNMAIGQGSVEIRYRKKDGSYLWVAVTGTIVPRPNSETAVIIISHDITAKKEAEAQLQRQQAAQEILLETSKSFNNITVEDIDDLITETVRKICQFDQSERSYVILFSEDQYTISDVFEWCEQGSTSKMQDLKGLPVNVLPWWSNKVQKIEDIYIPPANEVVLDSKYDHDITKLQFTQSRIVVPMFLEEKIVGFLGFDTVSFPKTWSKQDTVMLESVAQIIVRAWQRKKYVEALKSSENYYRTIFETTGAATMIIDEDMTILTANQNGLQLLGYAGENVIGLSIADFVPANKAATLREYYNTRLLDDFMGPLQYTTEIIGKDEKLRKGLVHVDIIPGTRKSVLTFADLTEFIRIDRALKAITTINLAMINSDRETELLRSVCEMIVELGGYKLAWVGCLRSDQQQKIQPIAHAGVDGGYLAKLNIKLTDPARGKGPTAIAILTGQPVVTGDFKQDESFRPWLKDALRRGFKSSIDIPLIADDRTFGILNICAGETDAFDEQEQQLLQDIADNLAYAVLALRTRGEMNQAARDLEKSLEKMQRILMQSVAALAAALNTRDPYTAKHQRKVVRLAAAIANEMGLPQEQIEGIEVAGNLHDIGKIYVPLEILTKPEKLSEIEFTYVKTHCQAGHDIVKDIEFPWPVAEIILQHHERLDGSGYPQGLGGEDILLEARIIAVADVVEAMASHRPYRPALGMERALDEITRNSGILYDPMVVDACCKLIRKSNFDIEE